MSTTRNKMITSLKEIFIPELRNLGFKGSFPHFRRTRDGKTNLLSFQFDKHGGGFVIEIANWSDKDYETHWGKIIAINKLTAQELTENQRIYPNSTTEINGTDSWFRYDKLNIFRIGNKYDKLAKKVVERIPIMEEYWGKDIS